ncbi:hypothetical protein ACEQ8H_000952 [Pleosporales sp. CAS-2024a]
MKFTSTAAAAACMAAVASALPTENPIVPPSGNDMFRLMALRSCTAIHYGNVQAQKGGLVINSPQQNNKTCENTSDGSIVSGVNYASFFLDSAGNLSLVTDNPTLEMYVDRSGMGQNVLRYTTGVQPISGNQERGPFKVNDAGNLVFAAPTGDIGFQACPGALGGGYSIWLAGVTNPGGNAGCVDFEMKAIKEDPAFKCLYDYGS